MWLDFMIDLMHRRGGLVPGGFQCPLNWRCSGDADRWFTGPPGVRLMINE